MKLLTFDKKISTFILLFFAFLLMACGSGAASSSSASDEETETMQTAEDIHLNATQLRTVGIQLGHIESRSLNSVVRVSGRTALQPQYQASVTTLAGGIIRQICVSEGNRVSQGQTVAYIENTDIVALQRDYLTSKSAMIAAEQEHERQRQLAQAGAGIEKALQQATAACHMAKAQTLGVERQLQQLGISIEQVKNGHITTRIPVKSPISGFIDRIKVATGGYVDMQTPIMDIVDNSKLHCDLSVFEKDIADVRIGQPVEILLTNRPDVRFRGEVYEVGASFEGQTKSVKAHVRITEKPAGVQLIPDMYVTALVQTGSHEVNALPSDAIVANEGHKYIFLLTHKKTVQEDSKSAQKDSATETVYHFRRVEVTTGAEENGWTQVTPVHPLSKNATVVTHGAFYLSSILGGGEEE